MNVPPPTPCAAFHGDLVALEHVLQLADFEAFLVGTLKHHDLVGA
jgi:hypothetical protein